MSQCRYNEALEYFSKTIKYADESTARDYFAKGFCETCIGMYKESIEDLDIALRLNPDLLDAYLIKGKCMFLARDTKGAFESYQRLISESKDDYLIHIHGGNLLMETGAINDALKAFATANKIKENIVSYYQQAKVLSLFHVSALYFKAILPPQ